MHCPKCGTDLRAIQYEGVDVLTCDSCGGELIEPRAIRTIVQRRDARFAPALLAELKDASPSFGMSICEAHRNALSCPGCSEGMTPVNYAGDSGIFVDRCETCGLLFFEHEELERIQVLMEQWDDRAPETMKSVAAELERARRETAEATARPFANSRFAFVNAVLNRLLDAA